MKITKKTYEKMAVAIRLNTVTGNSYLIRQEFLSQLCVILKEDNERFDEDRFLAACDPSKGGKTG